jgi:hypothetical protein
VRAQIDSPATARRSNVPIEAATSQGIRSTGQTAASQHRRERQLDPEAGAATRRGVDVDAPAVPGDEGGDDGQAQSGPAHITATGRIGTVEALEDPGRLVGGHAGSLVRHC